MIRSCIILSTWRGKISCPLSHFFLNLTKKSGPLTPLPDVSLSDEHPCMVDALSQAQLEHLGLQPPLQEIFYLQAQHVIQLHPALVQNPDPHQSTEQGVPLEESLGVLLVQGQQLTSGLPDLGQSVLHPPHLTLVPQPKLTDQLQLLVQSLLLERTTRSNVRLRANCRRHDDAKASISLIE